MAFLLEILLKINLVKTQHLSNQIQIRKKLPLLNNTMIQAILFIEKMILSTIFNLLIKLSMKQLNLKKIKIMFVLKCLLHMAFSIILKPLSEQEVFKIILKNNSILKKILNFTNKQDINWLINLVLEILKYQLQQLIKFQTF